LLRRLLALLRLTAGRRLPAGRRVRTPALTLLPLFPLLRLPLSKPDAGVLRQDQIGRRKCESRDQGARQQQSFGVVHHVPLA
jgi:hypothetical protein